MRVDISAKKGEISFVFTGREAIPGSNVQRITELTYLDVYDNYIEYCTINDKTVHYVPWHKISHIRIEST